YFDIVAIVLVAVVGLAYLFIGVSRGSAWHRTELIVLGLLLLAFGTMWACRPRAFTQRTPWLTASFSAAAFVALAVVFWPSNTVFFSTAMSVGAMLLGAGLILRSKTLSQPLPLRELFKLGSLAGGIFMTFALLELLLRLIPGAFGPEIQQLLLANPGNYGVAHSYIGHLQSPDTTLLIAGTAFSALHHTDALGFRNHGPW